MSWKNFLKCGLIGWCLEILFTSLAELARGNFTLIGTTSLWMFPIYGSMAMLHPFIKKLQSLTLPVRGSIYALAIFLGEYISGRLLKRHSLCPWDYRLHRWHIQGIIRLDFFPLWFLTGLLYEKLLIISHDKEENGSH